MLTFGPVMRGPNPTIPLPPIPKPNIPKPNRPKPKSPPNHSRRDSALNCPRNGPTGRNSRRMNTYAKGSAKPCGMNTYKIIGLKASCNQHLQKNGGEGSLIVTQRPPWERSPRQAGRRACGKGYALPALDTLCSALRIMRIYLAPRPDRRPLGA